MTAARPAGLPVADPGPAPRSLRALLPPLRSGRFWIVQAGVLSFALLHDILLTLIPGAGDRYGVPEAMTSAFLLVPVIYAALNFGVRGSIATSAWATALIAPHWWLMPDIHGSHLIIELGNLAVLYTVAIVVGQRVESEQRARHRAEAALTAFVAEQRRRHDEHRAYAGRLLAVQEEERRNLAQELHDDPLQNLMYLTRTLDDLSENGELSDRLLPAVSYGSELAGQAAMALREVIHGLRPPVLDNVGIAPALRELAADIERRGSLAVCLRCSGTEDGLTAEVKLITYRIVQESLNNVLRHAQASRATVTVKFGDPLSLSIDDDGIGMPASSRSGAGPQPGLGLIGMRERATMVGGTMRISARRPHGTIVRVTLPSGQGGVETRTADELMS